MGSNSSCHYFTGDAASDASAQVILDEKHGLNVNPAKTTEFFPEKNSPDNQKTLFRPPNETVKTLRKRDERKGADESKKGADDRWKQAKAEWQSTVIAELEEQERLQQGQSGCEPDRYGCNERQSALQAIREEEEERLRIRTEGSPLSAVRDSLEAKEGEQPPPAPRRHELGLGEEADDKEEISLFGKVVVEADAQNQELTRGMDGVRDKAQSPVVEGSREEEKEEDMLDIKDKERSSVVEGSTEDDKDASFQKKEI
jgi:hypothetical protein